MLHPSPERLEALVEGTLGEADRAVLESHVEGCPACRTEVHELGALFAALSNLPRLAPAEGFMKRVLAAVPVARPWWARATGWLGRLVPRTTPGWVLAAIVASLPALTTAGVAAWLFSRPGLSVQGLLVLVREHGGALLLATGRWLGELLLESRATAQILSFGERLMEVSAGQLGAAALVLAGLTTVSAWILYTNLIRPSMRERNHASIGF